MTESLDENFCEPTLNQRLEWKSPPSRWQVDVEKKCLRLWCDSPTDFWQRTHYGFRADNGHLLYLPVCGDVLMETRLRVMPKHQYDQAGLMIWISPSCWIKTSVEFEPDGDNQLGAVVTNSGYSDWSTQPMDRENTEFWFRMELKGNDVTVHSSLDGRDWKQLRVATLLERSPTEPIFCGLYACSPKNEGFCVEFRQLKIACG